MDQLCGTDVNSTQSMGDFDELDHVPLISRRNSLLQNKNTLKCWDDVVKREDDEKETVSYNQDLVMSGNCNGQRMHDKTCSDQILATGVNCGAGHEEVNVSVCKMYENPLNPSVPITVKVENPENNSLSASGDCADNVVDADTGADKVNDVVTIDFVDDDLDHIVLQERRRMLLERRSQQLAQPDVEGRSKGLSNVLIDHSAVRIKEETQSLEVESLVAEKEHNEIPKTDTSSSCIASVYGSTACDIAGSSFMEKMNSEAFGCTLGREAMEPRSNVETYDKRCSSEITLNLRDGRCNVSGCTGALVSGPQSSVKVKVEPLETNDLHQSENYLSGELSFISQKVKSEIGVSDELDGDGVEHMRLRDRMKQQGSLEDTELKSSSTFVHVNRDESPGVDSSTFSEPAEYRTVNRPRKRKKTATDSVETALEEDAPGLLKMLIEQGVSAEEIKLYGETDIDDALDESENGFGELEVVMSKLFSQGSSLLKFAPVQCTKSKKPSYCLTCLFSLVEQARYLLFRKWPVEWGWCRDLQSFIFVFERHNRIVLERPEYGYATYFFELLKSSPIDWQIKRLVTAMKLTRGGRVNIIENKILSVGDDLTEGEAKVLMEFGWVPNTGLGTMLHYCDRVYHDRKNEKDTSEWRLKIGKLLMDGYHGGNIVYTGVPETVTQHSSAESPSVKLEK